MMFFTVNKLWTICLAFACIRKVITVIVLDQTASGKPIWRESTSYRDRSQIPKPSENDRSKLNELRKDFYPAQTAHNMKKWKIGRIFYTMPIGATFPIFYTSTTTRRGYKKPGKKSEIYFPGNRMWKPGRIVKATVADHESRFRNDWSAETNFH